MAERFLTGVSPMIVISKKVRMLKQAVTNAGGVPVTFEPGVIVEWPGSDVERAARNGLVEIVPPEPTAAKAPAEKK
jgi:hypothetical protein